MDWVGLAAVVTSLATLVTSIGAIYLARQGKMEAKKDIAVVEGKIDETHELVNGQSRQMYTLMRELAEAKSQLEFLKGEKLGGAVERSFVAENPPGAKSEASTTTAQLHKDAAIEQGEAAVVQKEAAVLQERAAQAHKSAAGAVARTAEAQADKPKESDKP